ncbi:uncharacterized protein METZ01_LOCUS461763 [marine metagenome]|uniref:Uncharacterized protein n=1 Tax=marine metagenome TaxID=408172 RepID=A0A383AMX0_9ZZZZ
MKNYRQIKQQALMLHLALYDTTLS